jgi:hypothetical protein
MSTLSFISKESLADFMAKPQDLTYISGIAYEQFGEFKIDVVFDGETSPETLDNSIYPYGRVVKEFNDNGELINWR